MNNINIKITKLDQIKINIKSNNFLKFNITGSDINEVVLNTIRRVILELIPTYAFARDDIIIEKNKSIYNNDYMTNRISNFPIWGITNDIENLNLIPKLEYDANLNSYERKSEKNENLVNDNKLYRVNAFTMIVKKTNDTSININITTDDALFKYNGGDFNNPYKRPLKILELKPQEVFEMTCYSSLHIPLKKANYLPCCNCFYLKNKNKETGADIENDYIFIISSKKQLEEKDILLRSCKIIINKLNNLLEIIIDKIKNYNKINDVDNYNLDNIVNTNDDATNHLINGIIIIENESHTFGNIISYYLLNNNDVLEAAYNVAELLSKELTLTYKTNGKKITDILIKVIKNITLIFEKISDEIENKL